MNISIGKTLSELRKRKKLMQKQLAEKLSDYGFTVNAKSIYNWEKNLAQPNIPIFIALCDILDVDDVLWQFAGIEKGPYAGLNQDGRRKAHEFVDLLFHINMYKANYIGSLDIDDVSTSDQVASNQTRSTSTKTLTSRLSDIANKHLATGDSPLPRILRLYDIPVSAGHGNFLDSSSYEEIEVPSYVPISVDFALRVSGDSMDPYICDGQVIWVREQDVIDSGEIGIFSYSDNVYCKKLIADGKKAYLRSLNPLYEDIEIFEDYAFRTIGKVVS